MGVLAVSLLLDWATRDLNKLLSAAVGTVTIRRASSTTVKAASGYAAGVSSINLNSAPSGWVGVVPGDTFGLYPYVVTNTVVPVAGVLTGVTFAPALTLAISSGYDVKISHVADYTVAAVAPGYDLNLIAQKVVQLTDLKVTIGTTTTAGVAIPAPVTTDKILLGGATMTVVSVKKIVVGTTVIGYELQANG